MRSSQPERWEAVRRAAWMGWMVPVERRAEFRVVRRRGGRGGEVVVGVEGWGREEGGRGMRMRGWALGVDIWGW